MTATHRNIKSQALVTLINERNGVVSITEGKKKRFIECERFSRDYEALEKADPVEIVKAAAPLVSPPRQYDFGPRKMNEAAMNRQKLAVKGTIRKHMTADDKAELARVAEVPFCCRCGSTTNLQVSHAPAGLFGGGMGEKGSGTLLARLCAVDLSTNTLGCHEQIDQHILPDYEEVWLRAYARTQALSYELRKLAA